MKTIHGNNNIVLIENIDGTLASEIELDNKTSVITSSDVVNTFETHEELVTFIASMQAEKFPPIPNEEEPCEYLKIYRYGDNKVKCLQGHTRMHYTPEETPDLWLIIPTVSAGYPVWKRPTGVHDAYAIGDIVHYPTASDPLWISKIVGNTTVPDGDIPYNRYWEPYNP